MKALFIGISVALLWLLAEVVIIDAHWRCEATGTGQVIRVVGQAGTTTVTPIVTSGSSGTTVVPLIQTTPDTFTVGVHLPATNETLTVTVDADTAATIPDRATVTIGRFRGILFTGIRLIAVEPLPTSHP